MRRSPIVITILLFIITVSARAQNLSRKDADSLIRTFARPLDDTLRINRLLDVAAFIISKPGEFKKDLDSVTHLIAQARSINKVIRSNDMDGRIMFLENLLLREQGHGPEGRKVLLNAIQILKNNNDHFYLGKSYLSMADLYDYQNLKEINEKIRLVQLAVASFKTGGQTERMAFSLKVLADLHGEINMELKAIQELKLALAAYKPTDYFSLQSVYDLLGRNYYSLRDYKQAMIYELLAIKMSELAKDTGMQFCAINNTMALINMASNDVQTAITYYKKALAIAQKHDDLDDLTLVTTNLADAYLKINKPREALALMTNTPGINDPRRRHYQDAVVGAYINIYSALKDYKKAEKYAEEIKKLIRDGQFAGADLSKLYSQLIKFYIISKNYKSAKNYLAINHTLTNSLKDPHLTAINHKLWFRLDTTQKSYRSAVLHLITYNRLEDSLINENKARQIQELQVAYETSEKEKDIQQLQDGAKLQKTALAQSIQSRNFYLAGVTMLLLVLIFGLSRYRIKQQANAQLVAKQAEITEKNENLGRLLKDNEWLLREVHHRVKNNLQIVMSLLNSQSAYLEDEKASNAIMESQHRVNAMSLIHQKLYKSSNVSNIFMPEYISELVDYLKNSFKTEHKVRFKLEVDPVNLDVLHAIPLGLILNEVITNAIKYAFPYSAEDTITVSLNALSFHEMEMVVKDNGMGLPENFEDRNNSFGFTLVKGLTEELGGEMEIIREQGTKLIFHFKTDTP